MIQPPLSTVAQPIAEIAEAVAEKLAGRIEHPTREINAVFRMFTPVPKVRRIDTNANKGDNGGFQ